MQALIIAFDGVLADTLGIRIDAVLAACRDEGACLSAEVLREVLPGRTIAEAVDLLLRNDRDPTQTELVSLRAQRHYAARLAQGVPFDGSVLRMLVARADGGTRIVLRADSMRREVEPQLTLAGIEHHIALLCCADDRPSGPIAIERARLDGLSAGDAQSASSTYATLLCSWRSIDRRLDAMRIARAQRSCIESHTHTAALAAAFVNMSSINEIPVPSTDSAAPAPAPAPAAVPEAAATATPTMASGAAAVNGAANAAALPKPLGPDDLRAWEAAHHGPEQEAVIWFSSSGRWCRFHGDKATDALNGLVTNDVSLLAPGSGLYAAALSPKGKMVADLAILREDDRTLRTFVEERALPGWLDMARKYINPRLARTTDESAQWCTVALYGRDGSAAAGRIGVTGLNGPLELLWSHATGQLAGIPVRVVRAPALGALSGFLLVIPADQAAVVQAHLEVILGAPAGAAVAEVVRIAGGRPAFGIDMDETTIPQEANLETLEAISFTKGCYTGQETVARIHFRGHVNRHLRALRSTVAMPRGAQLVDAAGKVVGDVRSTAISPELGPVAIGMLRREIQPGATVFMCSGGGAEEDANGTERREAVNVEALPGVRESR